MDIVLWRIMWAHSSVWLERRVYEVRAPKRVSLI